MKTEDLDYINGVFTVRSVTTYAYDSNGNRIRIDEDQDNNGVIDLTEIRTYEQCSAYALNRDIFSKTDMGKYWEYVAIQTCKH